MSVCYVELTQAEAVKSTEEIVKDRIEYLNGSITWQEYEAGDQTYYGSLCVYNDGDLLRQYMHEIYIIRDNKVMKLCVCSTGGVMSGGSDGETTIQANSEMVDQYTQEILNSLELK